MEPRGQGLRRAENTSLSGIKTRILFPFFSIDQGLGTLTQVGSDYPVSPSASYSPVAGTVDPTGSFLYLTAQQGYPYDYVSEYQIGKDGSLTFVTNMDETWAENSWNALPGFIPGLSQYAYIPNSTSVTLAGLDISTGALSLIASLSTDPGAWAIWGAMH
jgi:hypothetical protein